MAKDKDDNRRAVSDHKAKKKSLGYVMKNIWISPETLVLISELKDRYKSDEELFNNSITMLHAIETGNVIVSMRGDD